MARVDNEDVSTFNARFQSGRFSHSRKTVAGDTFITANGSLVNFLNGGVADRNVYLPVLEKGRFYVVGNIGTTNSLVVRDSLGFLKTTLLPNDTALLFASEGEWLALRGWAALGVFTNTVNGLVPAPNSGVPGSLFLRDDGQWGQIQVTGIVDAFKFITDGTNTAIGSGPDTFRLRSSTGKIGITVTNNEAVFGDNANLTVLEAAVDHNSLLNFVANKHIDHTGVTLTAGLAITGGGDISASRTFDFAPSELTTTAGPVLTDFAVMDLAAGGPRRTLWSAVNAILNHNNLLNYVANQHIDHTGVSIVAGSGLSGGGTIAASRTLTLDINGLTADTLATGDFFPFFDISGVDNNKVTLANLNASLDHNALLNYVANQHIDHSTVSVSTTEGIQGGGTIAATRTHKLDISGLTADATPDSANDYVVTWDASASLHKKVLISNLPASGFNIHTLSADTIVAADEIPFYDVSGGDTNNTTFANFKTALGFLLPANNLSDVNSVNAALSNLNGVSVDFNQGWSETQNTQGRYNVYAAPMDALAFNGMQVNGGMTCSLEKGLTTTNTNTYIVDQWALAKVFSTLVMAVGKVVSSVAFPGFDSYLSLVVSTGQAMAAGDFVIIHQPIEGYRIARLNWGASPAQPVTIGFWTAHHRTGTYSGSLRNNTNARSYPFTYTQNVADAAEYKTVTIPGDTSGTWETTTNVGMSLAFAVASGTTLATTAGAWTAGNFIAATGTTNGVAAATDVFRITGVSVFPGNDAPIATRHPLIIRPFDTEQMLCMRYYDERSLYWESPVTTAQDYTQSVRLPVPPRVTPTVSEVVTTNTNLTGTTTTIFVAPNTIYNRKRASATGAGVCQTKLIANARM